ncbi:Bug family tripartite tricarboxylate transporter substrate binding protein [Acidovorax sp. 16-64-162]|uniref:Bug family tripartite tricarboxylate transporter substrate binding protein n=1 Tax=Acidovorax sp. 16-64-162 TaxID=1970307 RepID=UPI0025BA1CA3|nr:Bug family tripartite tricarboxylate transporter substrate binding protein [Acidovorax sp. 16-64-162]
MAVLAAGLAVSAAMAQPKPLRILVGFPPGGGTDAIARTLSERLKDALGVAVVVENRPGAGGQIAAQVLKASPPDGTTVFLTHDHTISILPLVVKNPGYQPDHDFVPVGGFATFVNAFAVSGGTPATEFLVKVVGEKFQLDLVSAPYRGAAPMMADMLGNQISAGVGSVQDFMENHKAGKLRVVAVLGTKRQAAMPQVPTFDELGLKGFEDLPYYGFYAPAGTSQKFITQFSVALAKVVAEPEVRHHLTAMGLTVGFMTPQQLATREHAYTEAWRRIIKTSGFVPQ